MRTIVEIFGRQTDRRFGHDMLTPKGATKLLQQLLPVEVVNDLRHHRRPGNCYYESVSICVVDMSPSEDPAMSPSERDEIGSTILSIGEDICSSKCLMKLEPIPDTTRFIAIGNLMVPDETNHVTDMIDFAVRALQKISNIPRRNGAGFIKAQAGVHCGSVTACVLGRDEPRYCLLGRDIAVASRLQMRSEPNHVLTSIRAANTASLTGHYDFFSRLQNAKDSVWLKAVGSQPS
jgi:hypothetical protein